MQDLARNSFCLFRDQACSRHELLRAEVFQIIFDILSFYDDECFFRPEDLVSICTVLSF